MLAKTAFAAALLMITTAAAAATPPYQHHVKLTPENVAVGNFPAQKKPILTVASGATVRIDGGGGGRWQDKDPLVWAREEGITLTPDQASALRETDKVLKEATRYAGIDSGHLLVGPIAVAGAMPGDAIEVRILSVEPRIPYATVSTRPGRGGIPDDVPEPYSHTVKLDLARRVGIYEPGIEIPLGPFMGVMGVLPPDSEGSNRRSGPPGTFGGNLDCKDLIAGTSLFLPVFHPGGLFYTGDSHAGQGDGEVTVSAMETANTAILQFIVHKGMKLAAPRAESPTHWMAFGLDPDLDKAMQMAIRQTNSYLFDLKGLEFKRAFTLSSIGVDFRVTQVVDGTQGIHSMIPKKIFVNDKTPFWSK
ncbi:Acetamidase/formamidase [Hydrocarboniphaga daqingensis]|uniref:Acetamidase/formamidase n=1 Tax=Hydrocarboniphaga daqingensis TaxID=490188 RepID=A0A1M5P152_9GAMM|nr:acetamidase/formamidase family protein [Hydrocarboniphaga daqingensis]SHG94943.1 Acetamidase/formamidase [Hydrocarboniphaga daqingensis]